MIKRITSNYNKNCLLLLLTSFNSNVGGALTAIALSYYVLYTTASAAQMSITLALKYLPCLFVPFVSVIFDRYQSKWLIIVCCVLRGILLLVTFLVLFLFNPSIVFVYIMSFVLGIFSSLYNPAIQMLLPKFVAKEKITKLISLLNSVYQLANILGILIAGVLVAYLGSVKVILFEGVLQLLAAGMFALVVIEKKFSQRPDQLVKKLSYFVEFKQGVHYLLARQQVWLLLFLLMLVSFIIAPMQVLLQMHLFKLGSTPRSYGVIMSLLMLGILSGNFFMIFSKKNYKPNSVLLMACLSFLMIFLLLSKFNSLVDMLILFFLLGITVALVNNTVLGWLHQLIAVEFKARCFGIILPLMQLMAPLALLVMSPLYSYLAFNSMILLLGTLFLIPLGFIFFNAIFQKNFFKYL